MYTTAKADVGMTKQHAILLCAALLPMDEYFVDESITPLDSIGCPNSRIIGPDTPVPFQIYKAIA